MTELTEKACSRRSEREAVKQGQIGRRTAIGSAALLLMGVVCVNVGLRVNTTKSIPLGLYLMTDSALGKGEYVIFCPPASPLFNEARERGYISAGFCSGDYGFMMKRVLAMPGDHVVSTENGVSINGRWLPQSAPLTTDKQGRAMPRYPFSNYVLGESELLLMSDVSGTSFDGRYFGPIHASQIQAVINPVLTW